MDQYVTLIENLEYDCFLKKQAAKTDNNSGHFNCCSKNITSNNHNFSDEMTKFSSFLDHQLKDIIEQQNALEKQYQNIQTNHNINNLNNLNNLINPKNTISNYHQNNQSNIKENYDNQSLNNSNHAIQENIDKNNFSLNISKSSNDIINECPNHHSHNNLHFSSSFTINNNNNLNENFPLRNTSIKLNSKNKDINPVSETDKVNPKNQVSYTNNLNFNNINKSLNKIQCMCENRNCKNFIKSNVFNESEKMTNLIDNQTQTLNSNNNPNVNKNDKFNDIDTLVAYINTNEESKTKKNKKKSTKKKNQQQKDLKSINKSGIYDEFVVENFRKNVYKDSCYAENIRKIKPIFSIDWLNKINNKVK